MDDNLKKNSRVGIWLSVAFVILAILVIVGILLFPTFNGSTVITGGDIEEKTESITCKANNLSYPFFTYDNSEKSELKIHAVFRNDNLNSISLVYSLTYVTEDEAKTSELKNHIDFEVAIQDEGLTYASLNSDHKIMDNVYQLTLYNSGDTINRKTAKYYLLNSRNDGFTKENVEKMIMGSGLDCVNN